MVIGYPESATCKMLRGKESEDTLCSQICNELENGGVPIGFVRWESKMVGTKYEVSFGRMLIHEELWAEQMIGEAEQQARTLFKKPN